MSRPRKAQGFKIKLVAELIRVETGVVVRFAHLTSCPRAARGRKGHVKSSELRQLAFRPVFVPSVSLLTVLLAVGAAT